MSKFIPFILFVVVFCLISYSKNQVEKRKNCGKPYDERQLLIQGKAYKYAFFTAILYFVILGALSVAAEREFVTTYANACIGMALSLMVFVTYSTFQDAYIGRNTNGNFSMIIFLVCGIFMLVNTFVSKPTLVVHGILQNTVGALVLGILFSYVGVILLIKKIIDGREA